MTDLIEFIERFFPPFNRSRRTLMENAGKITVGGLVVLGGIGETIANWKQITELVEQIGITEAQRQAQEEFLKTLPEKRLQNLVAVAEDGINPILRNKPHSLAGKSIGQIRSGALIPEAIKVSGNDKNHPTDSHRQVDWYYVPAKDQQGNYHYGGFTNGSNLIQQSLSTERVSK